MSKSFTEGHLCDEMIEPEDVINYDSSNSPIQYFDPEEDVKSILGGKLEGWHIEVGEYFYKINYCPHCGMELN